MQLQRAYEKCIGGLLNCNTKHLTAFAEQLHFIIEVI